MVGDDVFIFQWKTYLVGIQRCTEFRIVAAVQLYGVFTVPVPHFGTVAYDGNLLLRRQVGPDHVESDGMVLPLMLISFSSWCMMPLVKAVDSSGRHTCSPLPDGRTARCAYTGWVLQKSGSAFSQHVPVPPDCAADRSSENGFAKF